MGIGYKLHISSPSKGSDFCKKCAIQYRFFVLFFCTLTNHIAMTSTCQIKQSIWLIIAGLALIFLGLVIGLFVPNMANPRMALSAHIEGIMNGLLLMAIGLIWKKLIFSKKYLHVAFLLLLYGGFANLIAVTVAAITGFGKMMPLAGGKPGSVWIDTTIGFLLVSLALSMLTAVLIVMIGFYKHQQAFNKIE